MDGCRGLVTVLTAVAVPSVEPPKMLFKQRVSCAGPLTPAGRCGRLGLLTEGHDGNGGARRAADHSHLLGTAAHSGAQGAGAAAQEEEEQAQHGRRRVLQVPRQVALHPRPGAAGALRDSLPEILYRESR